MDWRSEEFGSSHEGRAGALLADGAEPNPVYLDAGSGSNIYTTTEWWVYNGKWGRQQATHLRGSCSCGWRGSSRYLIDWDEVADDPYDVLAGPHEDWTRHIDETRSRSIPLPTGLEDLLGPVADQLSVLAGDAPLAALKAVAALERTAARIGREAAYCVRADEVPWDTITTALGLTEKDARSRLFRYGRQTD